MSTAPNPALDTLLEALVGLFNDPAVELVRMSGLLQRARELTGDPALPVSFLHETLLKLRTARVIHFDHVCLCPHCNEYSYLLLLPDSVMKRCDTCRLLYPLTLEQTLYKLDAV